MKKIIILVLSLNISAWAQTTDIKIKDIPTTEDATLIEVRKKTSMDHKLEYQITEGTDDVSGDAAPLLKEARTNWKKACEDWKKELKELNKTNQVITLSCGQMSCKTEAMETTCKSTGNHKIKVKVN